MNKNDIVEMSDNLDHPDDDWDDTSVDLYPCGPDSFGGEDYPSDSPIQPLSPRTIEHKYLVDDVNNLPPIISPEDEILIKQLYATHPLLKPKPQSYTDGPDSFYREEAWIQTYSGRRFNPTRPHIDAIVIQDIAHSLSMQCRFSGHCKKFYSVAQHSVLVSYLCNQEDAL